jgi:hypothetical protein
VSAALRLVGFGLFAWKGKAYPLPARAPVVKVQFKSGESQEG